MATSLFLSVQQDPLLLFIMQVKLQQQLSVAHIRWHPAPRQQQQQLQQRPSPQRAVVAASRLFVLSQLRAVYHSLNFILPGGFDSGSHTHPW
jgi:hypothetical protein